MNSKEVRKLVLAAFFAAVIFLGTFIIKIPIPNGYIHFGDGFIYVAAALLPLPYAMAAAAIGGLLADLIAGFAAYAPFTAVVKLLIALVIGLVVRNNAFVNRLRGRGTNTEEDIRLRLERAKEEIGYLNQYDYIIVNENDGAEAAAEEIAGIIRAEQHKVARQPGAADVFLQSGAAGDESADPSDSKS